MESALRPQTLLTEKPSAHLDSNGSTTILTKVNAFIDRNVWWLFILLVLVGLFIRFYRIDEAVRFGWDQARDAWAVRNIVLGKGTLIGPRAGGQFDLGPAYFYFLIPFFLLTRLDPSALNYFNFLANIINFVIIFLATRKIFSSKGALFVTFIYAINSYLVRINQTPWNVTLVPGVAVLVFFSLYKIYEKEFRWFFVLAATSGFFFHLHFTAVFIPLIIIASLIFVKEKWQALKYALASLPLFLLWLIPNAVYEIQKHANAYQVPEFLKYYYIGFHWRFFLFRLGDGIIQFATIVNFPDNIFVKLLIPVAFLFVIFFWEKQWKWRLFAYLISLWFVIPLIGFTLYGGPISEYYFLASAPMVLYVLAYLHMKLTRLKFLPVYILIFAYWTVYTYQNTKNFWTRPMDKGLAAQKQDVRALIKRGEKKEFGEGVIESYLYTIWTQDTKNKK